MDASPVKWYASKIDWWIALLLMVGPIVGIAVFVVSLFAGQWLAIGIAVGALVFLAALYLGAIFPMRYGLGETALMIRHGMIRSAIPYASILKVQPTHSPLSSPALSMDRLWIQHGAAWYHAVMISPVDRDDFLMDLSQRTPLVLENGTLKRSELA